MRLICNCGSLSFSNVNVICHCNLTAIYGKCDTCDSDVEFSIYNDVIIRREWYHKWPEARYNKKGIYKLHECLSCHDQIENFRIAPIFPGKFGIISDMRIRYVFDTIEEAREMLNAL